MIDITEEQKKSKRLNMMRWGGQDFGVTVNIWVRFRNLKRERSFTDERRANGKCVAAYN